MSEKIKLQVPPSVPVASMLTKIEAALDIVPTFSGKVDWALLDWPGHSNVGDSAIWLGNLAILTRRFGKPPTYVTRMREYPADLDRVMPRGPIFMHGGGNFGDIWPGFQENRVRILQQYRHRQIIQLPQSIHFSTPKAADATAHAISGHPNFTLFVRDQTSLEYAKLRFDCPVYLCPDMAFGLESLIGSTQPKTAVLSLMRTDKETMEGVPKSQDLARFGPVKDWICRPKKLPLQLRLLRRLSRVYPRLHGLLMPQMEAAFRSCSEYELHRGVEILAEGEMVVTDRLHGHILCVLMGKSHVVFDNSYGKILGFIESWPKDDLTRVARAAADVEPALKDLASR